MSRNIKSLMHVIPSAPHSNILASRLRAKLSIWVAVFFCVILLGMSGYGFWQWIQVPLSKHLAEQNEVFYLLSLVIIPIVIFLFISISIAQRLENIRLSYSYQSRIDTMQKRMNAQEDFLHSMTDYNPQNITIYDKNNNYWFINGNAAKSLGASEPNEIIGKTPSRVLGLDRARKLQQRLDLVRANALPLEALDQVTTDDGKIRFVQAHYQPINAFGDFMGGIMVREEDVTSFILERERRETMLRQVINTLVAVVDRRDPFASGHSQRVGQLSRVLAEEMVLAERDIETAEIAGSLMNFGKVLVSRQILTKTGALTAEELQRVRDGIMTSADILSIIDFVGPVIPTLRQVLERVDGTGVPRGLRGDEILITARIVAVANTFVALASPRAHRPGLDYRDAVQRMMNDADKAFDRKVLAALSNCLENRGSKLPWLNAPALSA